MKSIKKKKFRKIPLLKRMSRSRYHVLVFIMAFAITGGIYKLLSSEAAVIYTNDPGHASQCIQNTPSKSVVRPGEQFTAIVKLKNTGTTTYAGAFGIALGDLNYPPATWNAQGYDLSSNIGPGGTASFNLTLRAPSTPGVYKFEWGIGIALNGFMRTACTGVNVTVTNPPAISLIANNSSNTITVTRGSSLTLSWTATNNPSTCSASGSWGGAKPASGQESRTADTSTAGTRTYTLTCANGVGGSAVSRTVIVTNPTTSPTPSNPSNPSPSPSPSKPGTPSRPGTPNPSNPVIVPPATATAPPIPTEFSSKIVDDTSVELTWGKSEYDGILLGYELDRSIDNTTWENVHDDLISAETFTDSDVKFETTYYYRLRAVGQNNLKSDYVTTEVTTEQFKSNTSGDSTLVSEDQRVSVFISADSIDGDAQCALRNDNDLLIPSKDEYSEFVGPYQILCKKEDGSIIENFAKPVRISINNEKSGFKNLAYFGYANDWQEIEGTLQDNIGSFEMSEQISFAVLGQKSVTPLWLIILISLLVLVVTIFGGLRLLLFLRNRQEQNNIKRISEDYYHKEHGI